MRTWISVPDQFLLYVDSLYGHVGFIDINPNTSFSNDLHLIAYSERPVGVAYDPLTEVNASRVHGTVI